MKVRVCTLVAAVLQGVLAVPQSSRCGPVSHKGPLASDGTVLPPDLVEVAGADYAPLDGLAEGSREAQHRQRLASASLGWPLEVRIVRAVPK